MALLLALLETGYLLVWTGLLLLLNGTLVLFKPFVCDCLQAGAILVLGSQLSRIILVGLCFDIPCFSFNLLQFLIDYLQYNSLSLQFCQVLNLSLIHAVLLHSLLMVLVNNSRKAIQVRVLLALLDNQLIDLLWVCGINGKVAEQGGEQVSETEDGESKDD